MTEETNVTEQLRQNIFKNMGDCTQAIVSSYATLGDTPTVPMAPRVRHILTIFDEAFMDPTQRIGLLVFGAHVYQQSPEPFVKLVVSFLSMTNGAPEENTLLFVQAAKQCLTSTDRRCRQKACTFIAQVASRELALHPKLNTCRGSAIKALNNAL